MLFLLLPIAAATAPSFALDENVAATGLVDAVFDDSSGRLLTLSGKFPLGLDATLLGDSERVRSALSDYLVSHRDAFGTPGAFRAGSLRLLFVSPVGTDMVVFHFEQLTTGGRPILDSELTAAFWLDGDLYSVNGPVRGGTEAADAVLLDASTAIDMARSASADVPAVDPGTLVSLPNGTVTDAGRTVTARIGFVPTIGRTVWEVTAPASRTRVLADDGSLVSRVSRLDSAEATCLIRHANWPRSGGLATAFGGVRNGTIEDVHETCSGDQWPWPVGCTWYLKYEPFGTKHQLGRIVDHQASQVQWSDPNCFYQGFFTSTSQAAMEQQDAFFYEDRERTFTQQNCWADFAQDRDSNVVVSVNDPTNGSHFDGSITDILITPNDTSTRLAGTVLHEYGHYVVWSYDDLSDNCTASSDEGDPLDETLGDAFALITIKDDNTTINSSYRANLNVSQFPQAHTRSADRLLFTGACHHCNSDADCSIGACDTARHLCDIHFDGLAFEQAIWELLFNRNCGTGDTCQAVTSNGNDIWIGSSEDAVIHNVGRGLAFGLKVLGQNITFEQVISQMRSRWAIDSGTATADRARAVFTHHGF